MRQLFLILLSVSGIVHAGLDNSISACPVPSKHMKAQYFTIDEQGKSAVSLLKGRTSGEITYVYMHSTQYILDQEIIHKTLNYPPNDRVRTPQMVPGCNKCSYDSPFAGISFYGCIH